MSAASGYARRSWLFLEGGNDAALAAGPDSGADVLIQELEDFTAPARRPYARSRSPDVLAAWRAAGVTTAVRINPLEADGLDDLAAVMRGAPRVVMLPKTNEADQVVRLDAEIGRLEARLGLPAGSTEIVPNIEQARGLINTVAICRASPRVSACLVASEDMAADLGAIRGRDGIELDYVRARFHLECVAAGVLSIDCPYTWTDLEGLDAETRHARRLGYRAKSAVHASHAGRINTLLTPDAAAVDSARRIVEAFEAARSVDGARAQMNGSLIEVPTYLNARRLLARAHPGPAAGEAAVPGSGNKAGSACDC